MLARPGYGPSPAREDPLVEQRKHITRVSHQGRTVEVPVVSMSARLPGPVVVVAGNVHGDEYTGLVAAHELVHTLQRELIRGKVYLYPTLNPIGLGEGSRGVGKAGPDLNRRFPGSAEGDLGQRLAYGIWQDLTGREPDLLLDLHADSAHSVPYAIIDRAVSLRGAERRSLDERLRTLAEATGLTVLHEYPDELYQRFGLDRSLAGAVVNLLGVPAVTIESGPRGIVSPEAVRGTVDAVLGVLASMGLVLTSPPPHGSRVQGGPWRRTSGPRTRRAGLFVPALPPGRPFGAGALLGWVRSVDGALLEEVRTPVEGLVVSWVDGAWLEPGTVVATLGVPEGS